MHKDNLEEFNYETTCTCDTCGERKLGTMLHAHDAAGMATPVLFLCYTCHPTAYLPALFHRAKNDIALIWHEFKININPRRLAEREANSARFSAKLGRVKRPPTTLVT